MLHRILPTQSIPMEQLRTGGYMVPSFEFSEDGSVLTFVQGVERPPLSWYVRRHAPDGAAVVLVVTLVVAVVMIVRVLRRPRERGRVYCRGCNHELVEPQVRRGAAGRPEVLQADARCSECGVELGRMRPVAGRSRARRMVPLVVAGLIVAGVCAGTIGLMTAPLRMRGEEWPWVGASRWTPGIARERMSEFHEMTPIITRWSLPGVKRLEQRTAPEGTYVRPLSDGKRALGVEFHGAATPEYRVRVFDLAAGTDWSIKLADHYGGYVSGETVAFDAVKNTAYVLVSNATDGSKPAHYVAELWEVDLGARASRRIAVIDAKQSPGQMPAFPRNIFVQTYDPLEWCAVVPTVAIRPGLVTPSIVRGDAGGIVGSVDTSVQACLQYAAVGSGTRIEMFGGPARVLVDVQTGQATTVRSSADAMYGQSRDRRFELRGDGTRVRLVDRSGATADVALATGKKGQSVGDSGRISDDGRYVAAVVTTFAPSVATGSGRFTQPMQTIEVLVWDLWGEKGGR